MRKAGPYPYLCSVVGGLQKTLSNFFSFDIVSVMDSNSQLVADALCSATVGDTANGGSVEGAFGTNTVESRPRLAVKAHCLWCGRAFTRRATGGSAQKFCSTGHRQTFWIAARRWTLMAIDAGLLSVECLKAIQSSVHADRVRF